MARVKKKRVVNSRLKAYQEFIDTFAGTAMKSGWKSYRGSWILGGAAAISSSNPSSYAISAVKLSLPNLTASAGVTSGTGLTYWVSDANSWVASVSYNNTSTSYPCNTGLVTSSSNPPAANCCSGVTTIPGSAGYSYVAAWNPPSSYSYAASWSGAYSYSYNASYQGAYSYSYNASYQAPSSYSYSASYYSAYSYGASSSSTARSYCCGTWNISKSAPERINGVSLCYQCSGPCSDAYSFSQCCPAGTEKSGSSCYYPATTSYSCPSGGSLSGSTCFVSGTYYCPQGGSLSGSTCTVSTAGGYSCPGGGNLSGSVCIVQVGASYYCPSGGNLSGSVCIVNVAGGYYCPSGGSLSGSSCSVSVSGYYSCPNGGNLSGTTCNVPAGPNNYSCFTQTTTQTSYNYYLRVIKSIGGAISTVGSDVALPSQPLAIKVVISGTSVASTAYSSVAMTTSLGTRSDTITSPSPTGVVGIIKAPSDYNQSSTVSMFSATI